MCLLAGANFCTKLWPPHGLISSLGLECGISLGPGFWSLEAIPAGSPFYGCTQLLGPVDLHRSPECQQSLLQVFKDPDQTQNKTKTNVISSLTSSVPRIQFWVINSYSSNTGGNPGRGDKLMCILVTMTITF